LVYNLIELLRFEHLGKEIEDLMEENKLYCIEFTKIVYDHEKGQDFLRGLKLLDFTKKKELIEKNRDHRSEIDKIVEEWENVKKMHECIAKVSIDIDVYFRLCNYKDKKFVIINPENYKEIKDLLNKNIKSLEDCVSDTEIFQISKKIFINLKQFKDNLLELYDIIEKIENNQINLEKQMSRANILQKNQDLFMKLKQAESYYKSLIDHIEESPKILELLRVKETIFELNLNLQKILHEIGNSDI
jgi:hypothetical protein